MRTFIVGFGAFVLSVLSQMPHSQVPESFFWILTLGSVIAMGQEIKEFLR